MKKKTKKKILYLLFILLIIGSGILLYTEYNKETPADNELSGPTPSEIEITEEQKETKVIEKVTIKMAPDVDLAAERKKNNNQYIVGRLEIPDLLNVLVAQSNDNEYYLTHAVNKKSDYRGSEFLDYRVKPTAKQINIYGHNSRSGNINVAFLRLEKFLDKTFFDNNQYIIFQHDGGKSVYKIIAIKEVYSQNKDGSPVEHMLITQNDWKQYNRSFVDHIKIMTTGNGTIYRRASNYNENSEIIVLQTCSHHWDNAVYIITGVKIDY